MKTFIRRKIYNLLLILSNRFPNRKFSAWKVMVGTSLLLLSGGCLNRQNQQVSGNEPTGSTDPSERGPIENTTDLSQGEGPGEDMLCYEPAAPEEDFLPTEKTQDPPPLPPTPDISHLIDFRCYDPPMEEVEKEEEQEEKQDSIYFVAEDTPEFIHHHLLLYKSDHPVYPPEAAAQGIEGRVVVQFILEKDGSITDPVVVRNLHPLLDSTALKVVEQFPPFGFATHRGKPVRIRYTLPITFRINRDTEPHTGPGEP